MTLNDWLIVGATLLGPILAVQAQKWVERSRETRVRKLQVFHSLMATRGARLSGDHVRALNMIDLSFYGPVRFGKNWRSKSERGVLNSWKEYLDHLTENHDFDGPNAEAIAARREELFVNLLTTMATDLGYEFDRVQLRKSWYTPVAHNQLEERQAALLTAATEVFQGERPLHVVPAVAHR
ncbi:hypothetical protein K6V90_25790 [Cupriavidus pauculus]|uniref:DUF6680 family protein n=1 Tax=Cupriavidus pauculus TaxID=82633 RepID=UPI001C9368C1|nr:DUF6680 family protein [Cupriavidus pauculus]MBY4733956.1 hypothetical protein [Cupriavidus pauculus]